MRFHATAMSVLIAAAISVHASQQVWTAINGAQIKAEFVGLQNGKVWLVNGAATNVVALNLLDEESRNRAEKIADVREAARLKSLTPAMKAATIEPRIYTSMRIKLTQIFSSQRMEIHLSEQYGYAEIFIKENGMYLSEPLKLQLVLRERVGQEMKSVPVEGTPVAEKDGKDAILLKRTHKHGIKSELYIKYADGKVTTGYSIDNPNPNDYIISAALHLYVRPSFYAEDPTGSDPPMYFSPRTDKAGVKYEAIEALMKTWMMNLTFTAKVKDVQSSFPYLKATDRFPRMGIDRLSLSGGIYGKHSLDISRKGTDSGMIANIYPGFSPARGFTVTFSKIDPKTSASSANAILTLELKP